jgi:hypothetical protein
MATYAPDAVIVFDPAQALAFGDSLVGREAFRNEVNAAQQFFGEWAPFEENDTVFHGVEGAMRVRTGWLDTWAEHQIDIEEVLQADEDLVFRRTDTRSPEQVDRDDGRRAPRRRSCLAHNVCGIVRGGGRKARARNGTRVVGAFFGAAVEPHVGELGGVANDGA